VEQNQPQPVNIAFVSEELSKNRRSRCIGMPVLCFFAFFPLPFQQKKLSLQSKDSTKRMSTQTITQQLAEYFKTQPVLKAWLFGSYSRGEQREESDIDILILPDKSQHFSLFTLSEIYEDLKELLGREVDLITDGGLMPFARDSVDRDKILIYERAA
jgi:predicted nucleotidyltransferase